MFGYETDQLEIALRIAHDAFEVADLKQAQIPMIILDAFLLEFGALFRRQFIHIAPGLGSCGAFAMIIQERLTSVRAPSVGSPG